MSIKYRKQIKIWLSLSILKIGRFWEVLTKKIHVELKKKSPTPKPYQTIQNPSPTRFSADFWDPQKWLAQKKFDDLLGNPYSRPWKTKCKRPQFLVGIIRSHLFFFLIRDFLPPRNCPPGVYIFFWRRSAWEFANLLSHANAKFGSFIFPRPRRGRFFQTEHKFANNSAPRPKLISLWSQELFKVITRVLNCFW